ncbi:MAG: flap endonuclease-1 [Candidatus Verstraetearchaeota archaeon]|nr:flap endonuclease-1 [Candidatus Verstraetearchaeota archaeon]
MGVNLKDLVRHTPVQLEVLKGRILAIDGYNALYQFLAIIRQPDGTPLQDSKGRPTSHLSGVFYRTVNLLEAGIMPVYTFDGKPPELKAHEISKRAELKEKAKEEYKKAVERGDLAGARKHAQAASRLSTEMVEQAKTLLGIMGVPWVQAPSEGEAQAAYMTMKGDAWATASQDYDSLLFGAPRLVRNLTISGRRKLPNKPVYVNIEPELVKLEEVLGDNGLTREMLIDLGILIGTDFNPEGFSGIGPKKALKIIKEAGSLEEAFKRGLVKQCEGVDYGAIKEIFLRPNVRGDYRLSWGEIDREGLIRFLCYEFDFSPERIEAALDRLEKGKKRERAQPNLERWF